VDGSPKTKLTMLNLKQPLLGVAATAVIIVIALAFISAFDFPTLTGWVAYGLLCLIPMQIVVGVLWKGELPKFAAAKAQPIKGLLLVIVTLVAGAFVGPLYFLIMGGAISPPAPMLAQVTIVSVVVMFWVAIVWDGWPFRLFFKNDPLATGIAALIGAYILNAFLFLVFFDYEFMQDAPVYVSSLDPKGLFNAWSALVFYVTSLSMMFLMIHFDLWPLTLSASVMKQPVLGAIWTFVILCLAAVAFLVGTRVFGLDPVTFLIRVPIPFIFGTIIVLNLLQNSLFGSLSQPIKGIANTVAAAVIGSVLAKFYEGLSDTLGGTLASGPPAYEAEIWLASALLSVTFPFLIFGAEFFKFWPLKKA
jgi:hypothetical protein